MKIESTKKHHINNVIRIKNQEIKFKGSVADVPNELGKYMLDNFPWFFEEGKVVISEPKKEVHVFDETMIEKQANDIVNLKNSLKSRDKIIEGLTADLISWKNLYGKLEKKFNELSSLDSKTEEIKESQVVVEDVEVVEDNVVEDDVKEEVVVEEIENQDEQILKALNNKSVTELKKIAKEMKVTESMVQGKKLKADWIQAIIDNT